MVAVLFARSDSIYKTLGLGVDVWDAVRDARGYDGRDPVVAHPPCRAWGKLKQFAKPRDDEKQLAFFAVDQVREKGGVIEHPAGSSLWDEAGLPGAGRGFDEFGGWTLPISQSWFGHKAEKKTLLYIVGCNPCDIPSFPISLDAITHVVANGKGTRKGKQRWRPMITKAEREHTPLQLANWLVNLAEKCKKI
jgi:hypothetical protein